MTTKDKLKVTLPLRLSTTLWRRIDGIDVKPQAF